MKKVLRSTLLIVLLLTPFANAGFGVASQYYESNPIQILPGETIDTYFKIQNTIGDTKDIIVEVSLLEGSKIATLVNGTTYKVPANEQVTVNLKIKIPSDAKPGTIHNIDALFKSVSTELESGTVQFVINIERKFEVVVLKSPPFTLEKSEETSANLIWSALITLIGIIILTISILITYFIRKSKIKGYPTKY